MRTQKTYENARCGHFVNPPYKRKNFDSKYLIGVFLIEMACAATQDSLSRELVFFLSVRLFRLDSFVNEPLNNF